MRFFRLPFETIFQPSDILIRKYTTEEKRNQNMENK